MPKANNNIKLPPDGSASQYKPYPVVLLVYKGVHVYVHCIQL